MNWHELFGSDTVVFRNGLFFHMTYSGHGKFQGSASYCISVYTADMMAGKFPRIPSSQAFRVLCKKFLESHYFRFSDLLGANQKGGVHMLVIEFDAGTTRRARATFLAALVDSI